MLLIKNFKVYGLSYERLLEPHIKELRILNIIESRLVTMNKIAHQVCVEKSSNLKAINCRIVVLY